MRSIGLPETKQSMILDGVDRGNWEYLNEMIINEEYCLFATANYQDGGTNTPHRTLGGPIRCDD